MREKWKAFGALAGCRANEIENRAPDTVIELDSWRVSIVSLSLGETLSQKNYAMTLPNWLMLKWLKCHGTLRNEY